ncbi:ketoacyl-ACP synthase III [Desulfobacterales bacterium HSG2]|nr:ketoacyl-ACP synthase III [Desulfobacterales bacterium HSG2]
MPINHQIMNVKLNGVFVSAIAAAMPEEVFDLTELYDIYEKKEVDQIIRTNGISKVRIAGEDVCASDLCEKAAGMILADEDKERVTGIVFVSQTPDHILPATSAALQHRLGLPTSAVAFDISTGCPGYVYGLYQGALLVSSGSCNAVLVCAGDVITRYVNPLDRSNRMVFGDAGSATLIEKGDGQMAFSFMTDGSGREHLIIPAGGCRYPVDENSEMVSVREDGNMRSDEDLFMHGLEIMNFSIREVPKAVDAVLAKMDWSKSDVGLFGFHQANKFMLDYLRKMIKVPAESVPVAMEETGNTGPASIPLMLALEHERLATEDRLGKAVLCGFGVGLSCAAIAAELSGAKIYEAVELE